MVEPGPVTSHRPFFRSLRDVEERSKDPRFRLTGPDALRGVTRVLRRARRLPAHALPHRARAIAGRLPTWTSRTFASSIPAHTPVCCWYACVNPVQTGYWSVPARRCRRIRWSPGPAVSSCLPSISSASKGFKAGNIGMTKKQNLETRLDRQAEQPEIGTAYILREDPAKSYHSKHPGDGQRHLQQPADLRG